MRQSDEANVNPYASPIPPREISPRMRVSPREALLIIAIVSFVVVDTENNTNATFWIGTAIGAGSTLLWIAFVLWPVIARKKNIGKTLDRSGVVMTRDNQRTGLFRWPIPELVVLFAIVVGGTIYSYLQRQAIQKARIDYRERSGQQMMQNCVDYATWSPLSRTCFQNLRHCAKLFKKLR